MIRTPVGDRSYLTVLAFQWRTKIIWQKRNLYTSGPVRSDVLWITDTDGRKVAQIKSGLDFCEQLTQILFQRRCNARMMKICSAEK